MSSGILCLAAIPAVQLIGRDKRWCILEAGIAGSAFVVLIPVLARGDSWQRMVAGAMLFLPFIALSIPLLGIWAL